jgi:hypothetical protein
MQQWEYLEVYLFQAEPGQGLWADSAGRNGSMEINDQPGFKFRWNTSAPALNDLGREGWELVSGLNAGSGHRLIFKRPRSGAS